MINHAERQRYSAETSGLVLFQENVSQEAWVLGGYSRKWPVGSVFYWSLQQVWSPPKKNEMKEAAE